VSWTYDNIYRIRLSNAYCSIAEFSDALEL